MQSLRALPALSSCPYRAVLQARRTSGASTGGRRSKSIFSRHLAARDIRNPFPGLPALEAAIGRPVVARIGSNESIALQRHPLDGVLPREMLDLCRLYPDPYARELRAKIAVHAPGVSDPTELVIESGADSVLFLILRTRVVAGDVVVTSAGTYPTFNYFSLGLGADVVEVPYSDDGATSLRPDLEALAEAAREKQAALVYLANPDNPTGHVFSPEEVKGLRARLPDDTTLIVDEAYIDFSKENALVERLPNTVQVRTLSKAYGLAGLRCGFAVAEADWVTKADQIRAQFGSIGNLTWGLENTALVTKVLDDTAFAQELMAETVALRTALEGALTSKNATVLKSATNFVPIRYSSPEEAAARQAALLKEGIAVHRPPHPSMQHLLRVTAGPQALDAFVIDALTK